MKSVIKEDSAPKQANTYPLLRQSKDKSLVVLFNGPVSGTIIAGSSERQSGRFEIGDFCDWDYAFGSKWIDFNGVIELSNS